MIKTEKILGTNLSKGFIKFWNKVMWKTFASKPLKNFSNHLFFIVRDKNEIVSLGELIPVDINYLGRSYSIFGIGEITSLIRKEGYGKILMKEIKKYLRENKKTGVGFCSYKNSNFYKKSGFNVQSKLTKRFVYFDKHKFFRGYARVNPTTIYVAGKDNFMKKVLSTKEDILIPIKHW